MTRIIRRENEPFFTRQTKQTDHQDREKITSRTRTKATGSEEETPARRGTDDIITPTTTRPRSPTIVILAAAATHKPGNHTGRRTTGNESETTGTPDKRNTTTDLTTPQPETDDGGEPKMPTDIPLQDTGHNTQYHRPEPSKDGATHRNNMDTTTFNDPHHLADTETMESPKPKDITAISTTVGNTTNKANRNTSNTGHQAATKGTSSVFSPPTTVAPGHPSPTTTPPTDTTMVVQAVANLQIDPSTTRNNDPSNDTATHPWTLVTNYQKKAPNTPHHSQEFGLAFERTTKGNNWSTDDLLLILQTIQAHDPKAMLSSADNKTKPTLATAILHKAQTDIPWFTKFTAMKTMTWGKPSDGTTKIVFSFWLSSTIIKKDLTQLRMDSDFVGRFWLQIQSYELETRNIENGTAR